MTPFVAAGQALATLAADASESLQRFFAATLEPGAHTASRLESILWWLPAASFATLAAAIAVEVGQALPQGSRWRRLAERAVTRVALVVGIVIVLNVVRAADIVGVF